MADARRLLFVVEDVTLAQVVRLVTLARGLRPGAYEVHFAASRFPDLVFAGAPFVRHQIQTLSPEQATRALTSGRRLYETRTLLDYIDAERRLIEAVRPDLVIGDFRLSLPTSAELCGVPSAVLINAYWSPFAVRERFPVPDHPVLRWLGEELTERYFPRALPSVFKHFANPLNAARKQHRLPEVGSLLEMLTHGSYTLYPDHPSLTPVQAAPSSHVFLGPVIWQPDVPPLDLERLWPASEADEPLVYATLGSSGDARVLPVLLEALAKLPVRAIVATAGRGEAAGLPSNVRVVSFARGSDLARRARLVVSNGGSSTGYQALQEGVPVLGIPANLDQFLATQAIVRAGVGAEVKARSATVGALSAAIEQMLGDAAMRSLAEQVRRDFLSLDSGARFQAWLEAAIGGDRGSATQPLTRNIVSGPTAPSAEPSI